MLQYRPSLVLKGPHEGTLLCLKFSPTASLLATADLKGWLCVWKLKPISAYPQYITKGGTGFLCMEWLDDYTLMAGMMDGVATVVHISSAYLTVTGLPLHKGPIEYLHAYREKSGIFKVATSSETQVSIWKINLKARSSIKCESITTLPIRSLSGGPGLAVTSMCWIQRRFRAATLLVAYAEHVVQWAVNPSGSPTVITELPDIHGAAISISPDKQLVVFSRPRKGYSIFEASTLTMWADLPLSKSEEIGHVNPPVAFSFAHEGGAILTTHQSGVIALHGMQLPEYQHYHDLKHDDKAIIIAIDAVYRRTSDEFFIASSVRDPTSSYIQIWQPHNVFTNEADIRTVAMGDDSASWVPYFYLLFIGMFCLLVGLVIGTLAR